MRPVDRRFMEETRAEEAAVERVIERLGHGDGAIDIKALLSQLPEPPPHAAIRIRNRVLLGEPRSPASFGLFWGMAVAILALLFWRPFSPGDVSSDIEIGEPVLVRVDTIPEGQMPEMEAEDRILEGDIVDGGDLLEIEPVAGLRLRSRGIGTLGGTERAPEISWTTGLLDIEVDPAADLSVSIRTSDGVVSVLGTVFRVERNELGTTVSVRRGRVRVDCGDGSWHQLEEENSALCLPTTAAGMLARARALSGDPEAYLEAVERGSELESGTAIAAELRYHHLASLEALERDEEALEVARSYLSEGGPREMEVLRMAAALALETEGCPGALPFLERLAPHQEDAASYHEACMSRIENQNTR